MSASSGEPTSAPSLFSDPNVTLTSRSLKIGNKDYPLEDIGNVSIARYDDSVPMFCSLLLFIGSIYFYLFDHAKKFDLSFISGLFGKTSQATPGLDDGMLVPVYAVSFLAAVGLAFWARTRSEWLVLELTGEQAKVVEQPRYKRTYLEKLKTRIDEALKGPR